MVRLTDKYVSLEIAKKLYECGFKHVTNCDTAYWKTASGGTVAIHYSEKYKLTRKDLVANGFICWCPKICMVIDWLYLNKNTFIYCERQRGALVCHVDKEVIPFGSETDENAILKGHYSEPSEALMDGIEYAVNTFYDEYKRFEETMHSTWI